MPLIKATIVHDISGRIVSINRPAEKAKVVVLAQNGHSTIVAEVESDKVDSLLHTHIVDIGKKTLVAHKKASAAH